MNHIVEGQSVVALLEGGKTDMGAATYCDCGALCGINMVGATFLGLGDVAVGDSITVAGNRPMPVLAGPLPEIYATEDGDVECEECMS